MRHLTACVLISFGVLAALPAAASKLDSQGQAPGAITIGTETAESLYREGVPFLDIRRSADWQAGRISGARQLSLQDSSSTDILMNIAAKQQRVVIYCDGGSCDQSSVASVRAVYWGVEKVYFLAGGFPAWSEAGHPTE